MNFFVILILLFSHPSYAILCVDTFPGTALKDNLPTHETLEAQIKDSLAKLEPEDMTMNEIEAARNYLLESNTINNFLRSNEFASREQTFEGNTTDQRALNNMSGLGNLIKRTFVNGTLSFLRPDKLVSRGQIFDRKMTDREVLGNIRGLDSQLERTFVDRTLRVVRMMPDRASWKLNFDMKIGSVFTDFGFVSTALSPHVFYLPGSPLALHIKVPKGTRAIRIGNGAEVLLDRGLNFSVTDKYIDEYGIKHIELEVMGAPRRY